MGTDIEFDQTQETEQPKTSSTVASDAAIDQLIEVQRVHIPDAAVSDDPREDDAPKQQTTTGKSIGDAIREAAEKIDVLIESVDKDMIKPRKQRLIGLKDSEVEEFDHIYTQRPLSLHGSFRLNRLFGKWLKEFGSEVSFDAMNSLDGMGQLLFTLMVEAPDLVDDFFLLVLDVPVKDHDAVKMILHQPLDEDEGRGGLSPDTGVEILNTFIAQNGKMVSDFLGKGGAKSEMLGKVAKIVGGLVSPTTAKAS